MKYIYGYLKRDWALILWFAFLVIVIYSGLYVNPQDSLPIFEFEWYEWWEALGLLVTLIHWILFSIQVLSIYVDPSINKFFKRILGLLMTIVAGALIIAICTYLKTPFLGANWTTLDRLAIVLGVAFMFLLFDAIIFFTTKNSIRRREFGLSLYYLELPFCLALSATYVAVDIFAGYNGIDAFAGGTVSFQLIVGTAVYAIIHSEAGDKRLLDSKELLLVEKKVTDLENWKKQYSNNDEIRDKGFKLILVDKEKEASCFVWEVNGISKMDSAQQQQEIEFLKTNADLTSDLDHRHLKDYFNDT